jgi:hypothetical protein
MDRRSLLTAWPALLIVAACRNTTPVIEAAPERTMADLARYPGAPLRNRGLVAVSLAPPAVDKKLVTKFQVRCAACGSQRFDVREQLSLQVGGETKPRGINLICRGCQMRTVLFDAARDGYDGRLGRAVLFSEGRPVERPLVEGGAPVTDTEIRYEVRYNVPADEIFDIAEAEGVSPLELFDIFELEVGGEAGWTGAWNYACT